MRARIFFSLGLLFLVCIVFAVLMLPQETQDVETHTVSAIDAQTIKRIEVSRKRSKDLVFEKNNGHWTIVSPLLARANPDRIDSILGIVSSSSHTRINTGEEKLVTFGLEPAQITVNLNQYEFKFGHTDPIDERRYLYFDGLIHLIDDGLFHQLRQMPEFFVSTRLVPNEETIAAMRIKGRLLEKRGNNWLLTPALAGVDSDKLAVLVDNWKQARARRILPYTEGNKAQRIRLSFSSGRETIYELVSQTPAFILGRSDLGLQYLFEAEIAPLLLPEEDTD